MIRVKRYASSTDVARLAGVSQSAVSRTYKEGGSVSSETRAKVLAAAAALDYRPSFIPRIMLTQRSNLVAVVVGGMYNPFYARVLEEFTTRLQQSGHQVLLVHADSGHKLDDAIPRLVSYRVDAIVSALAILSAEAADKLASLRIPTVSFNTPVHNQWISSVCCDNQAAAREIADLFVDRGARRLGFITGPDDSPASQERQAGFLDQARARGCPEPIVVRGDFRYERGVAAAHELLSGRSRPDALFCANDLTAIGAMDAARDLCLRIPEDLMVAGFDDIPAAAWSAYDLTTVIQDAGAMTTEALAILKRAFETQRGAGNECVVLPARVVVRGSVGPSPA